MSSRITIHISAHDLNGDYQEFRAGLSDLETVFTVLNRLVRNGVKLIGIHYYSTSSELVALPVDIFDGEYVDESLDTVRQEWETILSKNKRTSSPTGDNVVPPINPRISKDDSPKINHYIELSEDIELLNEQANELLIQYQQQLRESRMHRKEAREIRILLHQKIEDSKRERQSV